MSKVVNKVDDNFNLILVVDDQKSIHDDFRKILLKDGNEQKEDIKTISEQLFGIEKKNILRVREDRKVREDNRDFQDLKYIIDSVQQGEQGLNKIKEARRSGKPYQLAFVDMRMPPGWDGLKTIKHILEEDEDIQVVLCTAFSDYSLDEIIEQIGNTDRFVILKKPFDKIEVEQLAISLCKKWSFSKQKNIKMSELEDIIDFRTKEIVKNEQRFNLIFENATDAILWFDDSGYIIKCNNALKNILNKEKNEIIGHHISTVSPLFKRDIFAKKPHTQTEIDQVFSKEDEVITKTGKKVPVIISASSTIIEGETIIQVIFHDLRKLKEAEKEKEVLQNQLIQSAKLASIGTLASGVAHELNNPLTSVLGHANLLETSKDDPQKVEIRAQKIKIASKRMKTIIDHLRNYSREAKNSEKQQFEISKPIDYALDFLRKQLELRGISVKLSFSDSLAFVWGDVTQLESVFQNLFINSRDAFEMVSDDRDKRILIETSLKGEDLEVIYKDNATGIAKQITDRVFDPFFTTKEVGKGTGLGLYIVRNIIDKHQGTIVVDSEQGAWTKYIITLPIDKRIISNDQLVVNKGALPIYSKNPKKVKSLLIIDDDIEVANVTNDLIRDYFNTKVIADPQEALQHIENEKFDLILTDLKMPIVSGIDILLQSKKYQSKTPVVVMSGSCEEDEDLKKALSLGADGYLSKPFVNQDDVVPYLQNL